MKVSIHQPSYFPWLGLLHKIAASDLYVVMDEVQLADRAYQHRNIFLDVSGETKFLTIPLNKKSYRSKPINRLEIAEDGWRKDHLNFLCNNYRKHPFYDAVMPQVDAFFSTKYVWLIDALLASMRLAFDWFGISTSIVRQSELDYDRTLKRGDLIMALITAAGGNVYLSGTGAKDYLDESRFSDGLELIYDEFVHPTYPQHGRVGFTSGLACPDVVFNLGPDGARRLLRTAGAS